MRKYGECAEVVSLQRLWHDVLVCRLGCVLYFLNGLQIEFGVKHEYSLACCTADLIHVIKFESNQVEVNLITCNYIFIYSFYIIVTLNR